MSPFRLHAIDQTPDAEAPTYEVRLALGEHERIGDEIVLTETCQNGSKVDEVVDRLITQLNALRHKAKEKLSDRLRE